MEEKCIREIFVVEIIVIQQSTTEMNDEIPPLRFKASRFGRRCIIYQPT